jgi:mannose-6-phosphate isomerase-like protein (cupin superfamily)
VCPNKGGLTVSTFRKFLKEQEENEGIILNIEKETINNTNFRKVLFTGLHSQLVLMALKPNEDIGQEKHDKVDQFFRVDKGTGKVIIDGKEKEIKDGTAFVIPAGTEHNVIAGDQGLKLYSVYSPPNHPAGTIHKTKKEAMASE